MADGQYENELERQSAEKLSGKKKVDENSENKPQPKKRRYEQKCKSDYHRKCNYLCPSGKGETFVFCTACRQDFKIAHGGLNDVNRHLESASHKNNVTSCKGERKLTAFYQPKKDSESETHERLQLQIMRAEATMCRLIAFNNLPLACADRFPDVFKSMFPDSKIAAGLQCGRSKATAMVNHLARTVQISLREHLVNGPFTLSTDGSNDAQDKQYPLVVRTVDPSSGLVNSELLSVPLCNNVATGENIFKLIADEMENAEIPWENCLSLGCDNAAVMVGKNKGVFGYMKTKQPELYLSGCTLHIVHNSGKKAAAELPPIESVMIDIYYYFAKSAERQRRFRGTQAVYDVEQLKMLKHVCTRWMSIGRCLDRLLLNWDPLKDFFKEEMDKEKSASAYAKNKCEAIFKFVRSPTNRLYSLFLRFAVKLFDPFLLSFQAEDPRIHLLRRGIVKLLKSILCKFVKPQSMVVKDQGKLRELPVDQVEFETRSNQKDNTDLGIGEEAHEFISKPEENHLRNSKIEEFYSGVRKFYVVLVKYLKERLLPETSASATSGHQQSNFLSLVEVADTDLQTDIAFSQLRAIVRRFPILLPSGVSVDQLSESFSLYQTTDISEYKADREDATWANIGKNSDLTALSLVMRGILTIPHSSAHCERIFSCVRKNKTDQRASLNHKTLESLLLLKSEDPVQAVEKMEKQALQNLKSAYANSLKNYQTNTV